MIGFNAGFEAPFRDRPFRTKLDGNHEDVGRGELGEKRLKLLDLFTV